MSFIDTRTLPEGHRIESDVCIIGSGTAGLAIASQFLDRSRRVSAGDLPQTDVALHRTRLRSIHQQDFREGRVVDLAGWVLSITEVRLAALIALAGEDSN